MTNLEEWKLEAGEIPEHTCPDIDKAIKSIEKYESEVEYMRKSCNRWDDIEEFAKDLPELHWSDNPKDILEDLRKDNDQLRELGRFWYGKCIELSNQSN